MRPDDLSFEVSPQIVPANSRSIITFRPRYGHIRLEEGAAVPVTIYPREGSRQEVAELTPRVVNGALEVEYNFGAEQEYLLRIDLPARPDLPAHSRSPRAVEFPVYALESDLYSRKPYKGDLHMHSMRSDGVEAPEYVAAAGRRTGLDFLAITDHGLYAPSIEAMRAFENTPADLRIYPGEEVHPPENPVHMINFGGNISINSLFKNELTYRHEVEALAETCSDLPAGPLRYQYASCKWCYAKIQAAGGLGIFCHPYWIDQRRYNVPEAVIRKHFEDLPFGAYEVIGGYLRFETESNLLQVARYHEERAAGKRIPIVGVSDAHGCENGTLFGWYYTIVFAPSCDLPDLVGSIRNLYSVAVDAMPGEAPRAHGPLRLVKYAHFLIRELFPAHDELCRAEGNLMLRHLAGDPDAAAGLAAVQGQCKDLLRRAWDRPLRLELS
jgi:hypothetical protein